MLIGSDNAHPSTLPNASAKNASSAISMIVDFLIEPVIVFCVIRISTVIVARMTHFVNHPIFRSFIPIKKEPVRKTHIGSNAHQATGSMGGRGNASGIYYID